jgi:hypothetical protein
LDPDPNPAPERDREPECIPVPVLLRQKVTVPAVPVPQHIIKAMEKTKNIFPAVTLWLPDMYYYHFQFLHDSIAGLSLSTISLLEMIPNSKQGKKKSMHVR